MQGKRVFAVFWLFIMCLAILIMRIMQIAVSKSDEYAQAAQNQQSYSFTIAERRGLIYDCNRRRLTNDIDEYIAVVSPSEVYNTEILVRHGADRDDINEKMDTGKPFCVKVNDFFETDGVTVLTAKTASSGLLNHLIGYVNADGDGVGGIQQNFNDFLKSSSASITGEISLTANARQLGGTALSVFSADYENQAGVVLTIDKEIQKIADEAADEYVQKGAVVICSTDGEIKALVSRPNYDTTEVAEYLDSEDGELINRTLRNYNIGSIFKIVVAAAAIENKSSPSKVNCDGSIRVGNLDISCHNTDGHGEMNLRDAFINSCNPYFIECGLETGYDNIISMAERFSLGRKKVLCGTVMGSAASLTGSVVTEGLTANTSIGQGDIMLSPLDTASLVLTVINGGEYTPMSIIKGLIREDGSFLDYNSDEEKYRVIDKCVADRIKQMMIDTVTEGTGTKAQPQNTTAGGKTASAETGWKNGAVHGWFAGFFPADDPKYVAVVLVENGRSGSVSASPCFARIANAVDNLKSE